jgi:hypothetical protein
MLSEIGAHPIHHQDLNIREWDDQIARADLMKQAEVPVSEPTSAQTMLEELRRNGTKFLPLAVMQNGYRIPFVAADTLESGDTLLVLQQG